MKDEPRGGLLDDLEEGSTAARVADADHVLALEARGGARAERHGAGLAGPACWSATVDSEETPRNEQVLSARVVVRTRFFGVDCAQSWSEPASY